MNERDVFIAALQLESRAQRQAYLDDVCGDDDALRRQVGALLETHERAGSFLQEPVLGSVAAAALLDYPVLAQPDETPASWPSPTEENSTETQAGTTEPEPPSVGFLAPPQQPDELGRLGHYRVLRLLGQGGMGLVFLADDPWLQRPVALKVMRPELAVNPEGRQRFLREGRAAAQVRSNHVVTIYHVEQEGDLPYLVMEVLRGQSLAEALEQGGRLPLDLCLKVARQTAMGLAAAHASGLIHRDIKPANVWLETKQGDKETRRQGDKEKEEPGDFLSPCLPVSLSPCLDFRVKLLDFGLARTSSAPLITQQYVIIGTPAYMAPEQAAGQRLDARCDLFSLGAVLYHMLTGRRPFAGENLMAVLSSVANVTPPPAATLVPELPTGLADLLDRLLTKDPAGRPASADEVVRSLRALEQEAAKLTPSAGTLPGSTGEETTAILCQRAAPARRWRRLALVGGLGVACLAIGLLAAALSGAFHGRPRDDLTSAGTVPPAPITPPDGASRTRPELPAVREFVLTGHSTQVQTVTFTADSKTLVSGEYGGQVICWDMERRMKTYQVSATPWGKLQSLAVDPQQRWLAVGQMVPEIRLFHFGEPLAVGELKGHTNRVVQLAFLKDGRTLMSTGYDGTICRWDVEKQKEGKLRLLAGHRIDCLAVWEDGQGGLRLAYAGPNFVGVDDTELERLSFQPLSVALSPDGTRLACPAKENGVALYELPSKTRLGHLPDELYPCGLAFTPDGKHLVVEGVSCTRIYETAGGKLVARVDHPEKAVSLAVSPDGCWLAVGTLKGPVRVWHLPSLLAPPTESPH